MGTTPSRRRYPSDLTQPEWAQVQRLIPAPKPGGRPAMHDRREIVNASLYVSRAGCQWRALPHDLPPWGTVYWYFRRRRKDGTPDRLMAELRGDLRPAEGRSNRRPSAAVIDSQSVKTTERGARAASMRGRRSAAASGTSSSTRSA